MGSISPIHTEVSFPVILFCMLFFFHSLCVGGAHSFSAEVLIKRDSQFNYFYSGARPLESCSFSLSSYIFYLFSAFPPIFLPWLFILPNLTSLIISPYHIVSLSLALSHTAVPLCSPLEFCKHKHFGCLPLEISRASLSPESFQC